MKKDRMVLVLLVMWSLLSISSLSSLAFAGEIPDDQDLSGKSPHQDTIIQVNGATDDGTDGDPGDAGDGYGIAEQIGSSDNVGACGCMGKSILDEYLLILMSLVQLVI